MNNLVVVESPTKARSLARYLGSAYQIEASMGHVRDLPKSDLGIDMEHNFEPKYIIPRDKKKRVNELKKMAGSAKILYLATDPDREGEAIAWHISELLSNSEVTSNKKQVTRKINRVVFHEITESAIKEAFQHPRSLDMQLVDAQQARRVLDRLVGYKLSPLLWQKIKKGLSAGRVQSVTLRLIVEREREREAFKVEEYWKIEAELESRINPSTPLGTGNQESRFLATVIEKAGKKLGIKNKEQAEEHVKALEKANYTVSKITQKEVRRYPYPPFTTSTMTQTAASRLGFSAKKIMMLAQNLYEHGLITYMRTDSVNLSPSAVASARAYIENSIGKNYLPKAPRFFKSKSKNIQEAHEAIRVTDVSHQTTAIRQQGGLNRDHARLYELIWKRFVACQMNEAIVDQTTVDVTASRQSSVVSRQTNSESLKADSGAILKTDSYLLRATGSVIRFDGWLKLYERVKESEESEESKEQKLPELEENEQLKLLELRPSQHFTEPPPRYTEGTLIKQLEELGIGRPSTYAPILSTIQERYYVEKMERKFVPTALGFTVNDFLIKYFPDIVDFDFTAQMEEELDEIARGERIWQPTIKSFYDPFEKKLEETESIAKKIKMEAELTGKSCPECGKELVIRYGKFGKFLACSGFPECKHTEALEEKVNAKCPQDGADIVIRKTRRGKTFYGCKNWPVCKFASWTKPKSSSSRHCERSEAISKIKL